MRKAYLLAGLGYGDEGKGTVTDALVAKAGATMVVRYNGGAQAAHNVVTDDGRHHTFSQFGSGAFAGASTFLGQAVVIDPVKLVNEREILKAKGGCVEIAVDPRARLVTPYHIAINRIRERARGSARHGSTGSGIGETVVSYRGNEQAICAASNFVDHKLELWERWARSEAYSIVQNSLAFGLLGAAADELERADLAVQRWVECCEEMKGFARISTPREALSFGGTLVFEGAQGMLLDQAFGFHPYSTWSNVTFGNAYDLLNETGFHGQCLRMGITRAYVSRHGPGPLPTEWLGAPPSGEHNSFGEWQGAMRFGHFDMVTARYAVHCLGGVDSLAVTCLDHVTANLRFANAYDLHGDWVIRLPVPAQIPDGINPMYYQPGSVEQFLKDVSTSLDAPINVCSYGPKRSDKVWTQSTES